MAERVTVPSLQHMKEMGEPITALTAYDLPMARIVDEAGIDLILVGDSLAEVMLGYVNTLPVTVDEMLHHVRAVARVAQRALVVADLPFLSYQVSVEEAIRNGGRMLKEGGAQAVKLEGGAHLAETVRRMMEAGIPVMGHLGWTPQAIHRYGRPSVRGRTREPAQAILDDARALQEAGAFAIVLELIPERLASLITDTLLIPTIGIGAGPRCDGQVLVIHDMLGLSGQEFRHNKRYANVGEIMRSAVQTYAQEVRAGEFPGREHSFAMDEHELAGLDQA